MIRLAGGTPFTMPEDRDVRGPVFRTSSELNKARVSVKFAGCLDMETTPQLREFLDQLTDDLNAGIVRDFEFDVVQLYLMGSAAISCFASWVKHLKDVFPASRVMFRTNPNLVWQRRTLGSIRRVAEQIVTVE
jgi:hypothetical protein